MAYAPRCEADRFAMRNDSFLRRNGLAAMDSMTYAKSLVSLCRESFRFPAPGLCGTRFAAAARLLWPRLAPPGPRSWPACEWRSKKVAQKSRQVVEKIVARKLVRGPSDLSAAAEFARRLSSQSHRAQFRTLVSSLRCCRIRPDYGRILAACFQRSRVPLRDGGPCRQSSRGQARVLSAWHNTLKNIVELL
jgi:hypothetical protein